MSQGHWWNMPLQALNISTKLEAQTIWQRHAKNDQVFQPPRFAGVMCENHICHRKGTSIFLTTLETLAINFNHILSNESTSIFPPPKRNTCWLPPFCRKKNFGGDHRLILELLNGIQMIQGRRYTLQVSVSNPPMELIQNQPWPPGRTMSKWRVNL